MAGGDVTHGVAAGFAGGDTMIGEILQALRYILNFYIVKLNVLPRGDVQNPMRIFIREIRHTD